MSATIYWRPVKEGKALRHTTAPQAFQDYLLKAVKDEFAHELPIRLSVSDVPALNIAKRLTSDSNFQQDIQELIDAIERHDEIEVWAEY